MAEDLNTVEDTLDAVLYGDGEELDSSGDSAADLGWDFLIDDGAASAAFDFNTLFATNIAAPAAVYEVAILPPIFAALAVRLLASAPGNRLDSGLGTVFDGGPSADSELSTDGDLPLSIDLDPLPGIPDDHRDGPVNGGHIYGADINGDGNIDMTVMSSGLFWPS